MDSGSSPTTTTTTAAADNAAADVLNLIMKPHLELMQPQQQQHQQQEQQTQKMRKCALRLKTKNLQQKQSTKNTTTTKYNNNNNNNHNNNNNNNNSSSHRNFNKISSRNVGRFLMPKTTTIATTTKTITAATKAAKRAAKLAAKALATTTTTAKRPIKSTIKTNTAICSPITTTSITATSTATTSNTTSNSTTKKSPTTTTKEKFLLTLDLLAVVRRNASDKLKLIQMVHDNPILWDSRLPNFKGAEEEKTRAWEHIGKEFNAPGRRVARAFKSLRESYRRELAHVKVMGSGFKPKWSLYEAMDFLRDVIRERKGGSHMVDHSAASTGLNLSALSHHNAALTHHSNNNNNNHHQNNNNNNHNHNNSLAALAHNSLHSSFNDSALNLSSRSSLNLSQDNYNYLVKRELDLSSSAALAQQLHAANAAHNGIPSTHHHQQHHDTRVSSTRNDTAHSNTNHNNNANFDDTMDGAGSSSPRSADEASVRNTGTLSCSDEVEELDAIDADFPYPLILDNSTTPPGGVSAAGIGGVGGSNGLKRRRKDINDGIDADEDDEDEEDTYGGQMLQQHRHLRQQNGLDMPPPQTVREVLNSKFCGFISAKLNSMEDTEADNLMNKILMLLVQTQGNALLQEANK